MRAAPLRMLRISKLREIAYVVGTKSTNNVAEYHGLLRGLEAAVEMGADDVDFYMDSKLVVEQMNGRWKIKHPEGCFPSCWSGCADLPIRSHLSTGFYLRVYLFSQVAYNYIPVDLYPQPINQQNRSLRGAVLAPASPGGSLGCRPNQRFGCHQNTPQQRT